MAPVKEKKKYVQKYCKAWETEAVFKGNSFIIFEEPNTDNVNVFILKAG